MFHYAHPEVYEALVKFAREAQRRGFKTFGVKAIWERMRWHLFVERDMGAEYKLNNNYTSRYARFVMEEEPDLSGFFETRKLKAK